MHRYTYTIILIGTFFVAWAVSKLGLLDPVAESIARTNQIVFSFIAGALYSFSFTAALAVILFSNLTLQQEAVLPLAVIAAMGGLLTDITLLRFIKGFIAEELTGSAKRMVEKFMHHRAIRLLFQIFGALIIISPFPDEIGLTFLGISHLSFWRIAAVTFLLDIIGAYILITLVATIV